MALSSITKIPAKLPVINPDEVALRLFRSGAGLTPGSGLRECPSYTKD